MSEETTEVVESTENEENVNDESAAEAVEASGQEEQQDSSSQAETVEELQEEVEQAIEDGASEEEVKQMVEEFKLKVNGKEITKTLDWNDKDAIKRELQLAAAGREAMQETAEIKKVLNQALVDAREKPDEFLKELGIDPEEFAQNVIQQKIEEMKKTPEQLEQEAKEKEIEELRRRVKEQEEKAEQERIRAIEQQEAQRLDDEITTALDSHTDLVPTPYTVKRIADTMLWAMENGFEDVKAEDVLPTVQKELREEFSKFFDSLGDDAIETYLGKKTLDRMRKKRIESMKKPVTTVNDLKKAPAKEPESKDEKPKRKESLDRWMYSR